MGHRDSSGTQRKGIFAVGRLVKAQQAEKTACISETVIITCHRSVRVC
jgi:hypothetical protein